MINHYPESKTEGALKTLTSSLNPRDWLKLAEYVFLVAAVVGTLAAAQSGQFLWAIAPLMITFALNLWNRQRFEQQILQNVRSELSDIHVLVESLFQQIQSIPTESTELDAMIEVLSEVQRTVRKLETAVSHVESAAAPKAPTETFTETPTETSTNTDLQQVVRRLEYSLQKLENVVLRKEDWETLNVRFLLMDEANTQINTTLHHLQHRLDQSLAANAATHSVASNHSSTLTPESLKNQINELQEQIAVLQRINREIVRPHLKRLIRVVKRMQESSRTRLHG